MTNHRDAALRALYECSASLQVANEYTSDAVLAARIRKVANDILALIAKVATQHTTETTS